MRLPYGRRTGVEAVDRLTIIAHDRFQDIVDCANDPNSIIKKKIEIGNGGDVLFEKPQAIVIPSLALIALAGSSVSGNDYHHQQATPTQTILKTPQHHRVAEVTVEVAKRYGHLKSSSELSKPEIQSQIIKEASEIIKPYQGALELEPDSTNAVVKEVVETVTKNWTCIVLIPHFLRYTLSKKDLNDDKKDRSKHDWAINPCNLFLKV